MISSPVIPQNIVVHLGRPGDDAQNINVSFPDYIKNVASSELYPTWPESALRANIYAIISFALNRIYTDWYPSQGYSFDITNSTAFDQYFIPGRDIFGNISQIVEEIFNDYVRRQGFVEPYFTEYCDGRNVTCDGLSQWGSVSLANQGYTPYEILQYYYGDDIEIVREAPVRINMSSYPGFVLRVGTIGNEVRSVQTRLNRISDNYPAIPKISPVDAVFDLGTADAVKAFQKIFNLPQTGEVDKSTWYKIAYIYTSVKRLADLNSEGLTLNDVIKPFPDVLREGDQGTEVEVLQYYLAILGQYNSMLNPIAIDGIFGPSTKRAVIEFQNLYGLSPDGIVGRNTWAAILNAYDDIIESRPPDFVVETDPLFQGTFLREGSSGAYVTLLQEYLFRISQAYPQLPSVSVTGYFGPQTKNAVIAFQKYYGYVADELVGPILWNDIVSAYQFIENE